eukprot:TRINITY_DN7536_c0_g2_i2.p2 TRINITY_DN7536_c0_g2~~TRINITY_DN7536_c0_g2_i2.p2  ORF type:complete len:122 (-),score=26.01 TRINITY_DN7536_c0_g2_i2:23-388(-)
MQRGLVGSEMCIRDRRRVHGILKRRMSAIMDRDFVMGFLSGVGIAGSMKIVKELIHWVYNRKGKASFTKEMAETLKRKLIQILCFIALSKQKTVQQSPDPSFNYFISTKAQFDITPWMPKF